MNTESQQQIANKSAKEIVQGFLMLQNDDNLDAIESIILSAIETELTALTQGKRQEEEQLRNLTEAHIIQKKIDDDKLLSALAAIEKHNKKCQKHISLLDLIIDVDLSLLAKHDAEVRAKTVTDLVSSGANKYIEERIAEVRKPLVDALE